MKLDGKVAVVTGAGSGMGLAIAELFAKEGAKIVANDWNEKSLDQMVTRLSGEGHSIKGLQGNIADQADAEELVNLAVDTYGSIDILVNNAGVNDLWQGVAELTNDAWERTIGVNLNGPMFTSRCAIPTMIEQGGGSIINIASTAAISGAPAGAAYVVSKHGVVGLTRNTAWIYAKEGIRCNAICPGGVATNILESSDQSKFDPKGTERISTYISIMPGLGKPMDIASLALFLGSDDASFINGAIIPIDAGWTAA